jgi:hypothetical protein
MTADGAVRRNTRRASREWRTPRDDRAATSEAAGMTAVGLSDT